MAKPVVLGILKTEMPPELINPKTSADILRKVDFLTRDKEYVTLDALARSLSVYSIGSPGMGKTTLLENIALQDMENGDGLCFIDPTGNAAERLIQRIPAHRKDDVIYWNVADLECPFGINPFQCDLNNPLERTVVPQNFVLALESLKEFRDVFELGVRMRDLLLKLAHAFVANQGRTLLEAIEFLDSTQAIQIKDGDKTEKTHRFRSQFYPKLAGFNPFVLDEWKKFDALPVKQQHDDAVPSLNKLRRFVMDSVMQGIFSQSENSINFRSLIDERKILIVRLADIGSYNAAFIGAFIVSGIWTAALTRNDTEEEDRPQFHLFADEFQDYMTKTFEDMQRKVRQYGVDTFVAHQERGTLGDDVRSTTLTLKNKVVFSISGKDARDLSDEFQFLGVGQETRQVPKLAYATNVMEHLGTHSHENKDVRFLYQWLRRNAGAAFDAVLDKMAKTESRPLKWFIPGYPKVDTAAVRGQVTARRAEVDAMINQWLYACMAENYDPYRIMYEFESFPPDDDELFDIYFEMNCLMLKTAEPYLRDKDMSSLKHAPNFADLVGKIWEGEKEIRLAIAKLGQLLNEQPCYVPTGQYETKTTPSRGTTLAGLSAYTAYCSLFQDNAVHEYTIQTLPLPPETEEGRQQGVQIKAHSRKTYGRCGEQGRTSTDTTPPDATIDTHETSQTDTDRPGEQKTNYYDDDGPI